MMWKIAECYEAEDNKDAAIQETEMALRLIKAMSGEDKITNFQSYVDYFHKQIERMKS